MKAMIYRRYGAPEVLQPAEVAKPQPKDDDILVNIHATTVTHGDSRMRAFRVPAAFWIPSRIYLGLFGPRRKILGMEVAGVVESVGSQVTRFQPGDAVFASTYHVGFGGYAEYQCFPQDGIVAKMPETLGFGEAATLAVGAGTALRFLRKGNIKERKKTMIYGASGSVGSFAVQLAKHFGTNVTAVCREKNHELVKSLGADAVLDYTKDEFHSHEGKYDLVFDAVGKLSRKYRTQFLEKEGAFISVNGGGKETTEQMETLAELANQGVLNPVVSRRFDLQDIREAHSIVDSGHKVGNIVINVRNQED